MEQQLHQQSHHHEGDSHHHGHPNPGLIFETFQAHWRTRALHTAIELELFGAVHSLGSEATAERVANALSLPLRSTRILLDFLTVVGFFIKEKAVYSCTPSSAVFLVKSSPAYMGGMANFLLSSSLVSSLGELTTTVKTGMGNRQPTANNSQPASQPTNQQQQQQQQGGRRLGLKVQ